MLHKPLRVGDLSLAHRVVLAPLTRLRASEPGLAPRKMHAEYYGQRASKGGLLISEATCISPEALGYPSAPGIFTQEQVEGWKKVTKAVHAKGGHIFCQLWHVGRVAHTDFASHPIVGASPPPGVSSSAIAIKGNTRTYNGKMRYSVPRPLKTDEVARVCQDYVHAAQMAREAGFDGVELHAAHGYLIDQFLNNGANNRTDKYGGTVENRCRFLFEAIEAILTVWPSSRVGVRLSPHGPGTITFHGCTDDDPHTVFSTAIQGLNRYNLAYLLLTEPRWFGGAHDNNPDKDPGFKMPLFSTENYRHLFKGPVIAAGGFTPKTAEEAVAEGKCDLVAFGRWFIANPDLPERLRTGAPLNRYNRDTFYTYEEEGYTDYPFLEDADVDTKYPLVEQSTIGTSLSSKL